MRTQGQDVKSVRQALFRVMSLTTTEDQSRALKDSRKIFQYLIVLTHHLVLEQIFSLFHLELQIIFESAIIVIMQSHHTQYLKPPERE